MTIRILTKSQIKKAVRDNTLPDLLGDRFQDFVSVREGNNPTAASPTKPLAELSTTLVRKTFTGVVLHRTGDFTITTIAKASIIING